MHSSSGFTVSKPVSCFLSVLFGHVKGKGLAVTRAEGPWCLAAALLGTGGPPSLCSRWLVLQLSSSGGVCVRD